ncbi:hypothetical protein Hanom_Chr12g01140381 [Helianthus anomalus]
MPVDFLEAAFVVEDGAEDEEEEDDCYEWELSLLLVASLNHSRERKQRCDLWPLTILILILILTLETNLDHLN